MTRTAGIGALVTTACVTTACGLLLAAAGAASATDAWGPWTDGWWPDDGAAVLDLGGLPGCDAWTGTCVNGPLGSGNSRNSGNVVLHGTINDSGSPTTAIGSTNSGNTVTGPADHADNNYQYIGRGGHRRR